MTPRCPMYCALSIAALINSEVHAVQVFNEDVAIQDPTPGIILNDTDVIGEEWYIRGRQEYFGIVDVQASETNVLYVDPNLRSVSIGYFTSASDDFTIALGFNASSQGARSTALGYEAEAQMPSSTALGSYAAATKPSSTAVGDAAIALGESSIALGSSSAAVVAYSTGLGYHSSAGGEHSVAIGSYSNVMGTQALAIGSEANAIEDYSAALGWYANASAEAAMALGYGAGVSGTSSTALGALAYAPNPDTVIIGSEKGVNGATAYANVGMGTSTPVQAVDVERSAAAARFQLTSFTNTANEAPQYIQRRARGTSAAPSAVLNNDNLGLFSFRGYNGSVMGGSRATITAQAAGNFTTTSTPTRLIFATTPVGQTVPQQVLVITPDGKVQVNGQNLNVPDYVFEDDYPLMPLEELQAFIDENGHLPGIAPAGEVNEHGLDLVGSQMGQLQKIEELTLYALRQQETISNQHELIKRLEVALEDFRSRLAKLEAGTGRN